MLQTVKKHQFLLLSLTLSANLALSQPMNSSKKSNIKAAKEFMQFEEYERAIPVIEELLKTESGSAWYNFWMGKCLYLTYKRNKALSFLDVANYANPDIDKEFHHYYALTLHYNLRLDDAIAQYKLDAERYLPNSPEYQWNNNRISQCVYAKGLVKKLEGKRVIISNMGPKINSNFAEHSPVISANDSILVYTARRPDCLGARPDEEFYDEDVYYARKIETEEWTIGRNIGSPVNAKGHDATIALTADGKRLYIYRHKKDGGLYVTDFDEEGNRWKDPKPMEKPFNSKHYEACIWQSADGKRMLFSSDRPGGYGGRDIYVCEKQGKHTWSEPENLGPTVNTPFDEDAPFLHPDGRTLYYSSNGPNSMGGFDIFVTEFDTTNGNWLNPLNMGYPVNTPDEDIYFVISASGEHGYYSSGKEGGFGEKDIYRIDFPYFPYPRRNHIIEITGIVQDEKNLDTLEAWIVLFDNSSQTVIDSFLTGPHSGNYFFELSAEFDYSLKIKSVGYDQVTDFFNTPGLIDKDIFLEKNYMLGKPEITTGREEIEIMNVYFDFDEYGLRKESQEEIDRAIKILRENPEISLELRGHTDWFGTYQYNLKLSQSRSFAVQKYLVANNIDPDRLMLTYKSENAPLETNENDKGRQFNRRTEMIFYRNGEVALTSKKLRSDVKSIYVDHTKPKGLPGYDNPGSQEGMPNEGGMTAGNHQTQGMERDYTIAVKPGSASISTTITEVPGNPAISDDDPGSTDHEVEIPEVFAGVVLHHIYFDFDQYDLRQKAMDELNKVKWVLEEDLRLRLEIYGHTDAFGSVDYNQKLSENRCKTSSQYLQKNGIDPSQSFVSGFSELEPIDTNEHPDGRQNNRRVEFRFYLDNQLVYQSVP